MIYLFKIITVVIINLSCVKCSFLENIFKIFNFGEKSDFLIYKGNIPDFEEFPYTVFIEIFGRSQLTTCGGAIVNKEWILSAAHCVTGPIKGITITAGAVNLKNTRYIQKRRGKRVIIHKKHQPKRLGKNDISLIQTENPYIFTKQVNYIIIAQEPWFIGTSKECIVGGWGQTEKTPHPDQMRVIDVIAERSLSACPCAKVEEVMNIICALSDKKQTPCYGDSGNPLVCEGQLFGVTHMLVEKSCTNKSLSKRKLNCGGNVYTTFINIQQYRSWINKSINDSENFPIILPPTSDQTKLSFFRLILLILLLTIYYLK